MFYTTHHVGTYMGLKFEITHTITYPYRGQWSFQPQISDRTVQFLSIRTGKIVATTRLDTYQGDYLARALRQCGITNHQTRRFFARERLAAKKAHRERQLQRQSEAYRPALPITIKSLQRTYDFCTAGLRQRARALGIDPNRGCTYRELHDAYQNATTRDYDVETVLGYLH